MNGLFGLLEGKLRISLTDATMMWIVHYAMDRAHSKVKSKDGVIHRLNEKDAICTLINDFVSDFKENFEMEVRKQEKQVFMSLSEHLSDLMTEVACLRNELQSFINQN